LKPRCKSSRQLSRVYEYNCPMAKPRSKHKKTLSEKYPPSAPCSCEVCVGFCDRPGWWTVTQADQAIQAGYAQRMMLELSPDRTFGVLSPAFKGCEGNLALEIFSKNGCTFLKNGLCELFESGFEPLECLFCHHERSGQGVLCHQDLEDDWNSHRGKLLVEQWGTLNGLSSRLSGLTNSLSRSGLQ